jgi:hypothetical protein
MWPEATIPYLISRRNAAYKEGIPCLTARNIMYIYYKWASGP